MKDIAQDLGVSVITVSKALRDVSDISEETRDRVLKRSRELGYQPNLAARSLVTGRTQLIGVVVPDLVHAFFGEVAKGLSRELHPHGYSLVICSSEEDPNREREQIERLLAQQVDALILASADSSEVNLRQIAQYNTPHLLIDRRWTGSEAHFVGVDDELAGTMAVEHLIAQERRRIAHIRGLKTSTALGRLKGYRRALSAHGLAMPEKYVVAGKAADDAAEASGHAAMQELLLVSPRPDAVFCYNDPIALGAMRAILEADLRIPNDIAIVGCGNVTYAGLLRVPLTSVDQQTNELGRRTAQQILKLIESETPIPPEAVLLEPRLVVRESSDISKASS